MAYGDLLQADISNHANSSGQEAGTVLSRKRSACGRYLWSVTVAWGPGPKLLAVLFQPNSALHDLEDPTVSQLRSIAAHNGFDSLVMVYGIPLHSLYPGDAIAMARAAASGAKKENLVLRTNLQIVAREVRDADAVLLGWGARARKCLEWFDRVTTTVHANLSAKQHVYCLDKTAGGFPMSPLAKGVCAVPRTAQLLSWQ